MRWSTYARRTAFLFEWFTSKRLDISDSSASAYDDLLDSQKYLAASKPTKNQRWKINDNLPGTRSFCPLVRLTPALTEACAFDLAKELDRLDKKFGADLLLRSAAWLTFAESKASFLIEKEQDRTSEIQRFASAMASLCGRMDEPLSNAGLERLQAEVLGQRALKKGIRKSPVFIARAAHHEAMPVSYIAPNHEMLPDMLEGLRTFDLRTKPILAAGDSAVNSRSLIRATAISFGFVYIHPLADGNGRVHRLLINDVIMRDGLVPLGVILPISSTIVKSSTKRGQYEQALESISSRLMRKHNSDWRFGKERVCEDGVITDFEFDGNEDAQHLWRFPDLTLHCTFMAGVVKATVLENMTQEAELLAHHDEARIRLKQVYEMPNPDADAIIRSLRENQGRVSGKILERYPIIFEDPDIAGEAVEAVMSALEGREQEDVLGFKQPKPEQDI